MLKMLKKYYIYITMKKYYQANFKKENYIWEQDWKMRVYILILLYS